MDIDELLYDESFLEPFLIWTPQMTPDVDPDQAIADMIQGNDLLDDALREQDLEPVLDCLAEQGRDPLRYLEGVETELRLRYHCPELIGRTF